MRRTAAAVLLAALLALTGCSNSGDGKPTKPTPAATSSAPAKQTKTEQLAACTDAIAAGHDSSAPECADLSSDDYLKALQDANKQGRDALESAIASASSQP